MILQQYQQKVFDAAKGCGLTTVQAKIIVAQAMHESAKFSSNVFKTDNNCFGMKMPSVRNKKYIERASTITMIAEGSTPYAHYSSIENCVKDLIIGWHGYNKTNWNNITSPAAYAAYLKTKNYYGNSPTAETVYRNALNSYYGSLIGLEIQGGNYTKYIAPVLIGAVVLYLLS